MSCGRKFEIENAVDLECGGAISDWGSNVGPTKLSGSGGCSSGVPTTCRWCETGKYRAATGQCVECEVGKYRDTVGGGACKACPAHSDSAAGSSACHCNPGSYPQTGGFVAPNNTRLRLAASWPELVSGQSRTPSFFNSRNPSDTICGRVEVSFELNWQSTRGATSYDPGTWGGVYSENEFGFSDSEAKVVCRELGLSGGRHLPVNAQFNFFKPMTGPLWIKFDQGSSTGCNGSEASLLDCQYEFSETSFCSPSCLSQNSMYYAQICCEGNIPPISSLSAYVDHGSCTECAVGTYKSTNGSVLCQYCPPGKYSDVTGATA